MAELGMELPLMLIGWQHGAKLDEYDRRLMRPSWIDGNSAGWPATSDYMVVAGSGLMGTAIAGLD